MERATTEPPRRSRLISNHGNDSDRDLAPPYLEAYDLPPLLPGGIVPAGIVPLGAPFMLPDAGG